MTYHQVFHRETSLTRWGGGLENYGAAYTFFQYLWERAGGNGTSAGGDQYTPDEEYSVAAGDLLIKTIFEEQANGMEGVQNAITTYNALTAPPATTCRRCRSCSRTGRWRSTSTTRPTASTTSRPWTSARSTRRAGRSTLPTTSFGRTAAPTPAPHPRGASRTRRTSRHSRHCPSARPTRRSATRVRRSAWTSAVPRSPRSSRATPTGSGSAGARASPSTSWTWTAPCAGGQTVTFNTWYFIEQDFDYGYVEALVDGTWVTVPISSGGQVITTSTDPNGNNEEGNGLTGTSGGEYFVDYPALISASAVAARRHDRRAVPLLDRPGLPRHRLVREGRRGGRSGSDAQRACGQRLDRHAAAAGQRLVGAGRVAV